MTADRSCLACDFYMLNMVLSSRVRNIGVCFPTTSSLSCANSAMQFLECTTVQSANPVVDLLVTTAGYARTRRQPASTTDVRTVEAFESTERLLSASKGDVAVLLHLLRVNVLHLTGCLRCGSTRPRALHSPDCCLAGHVWAQARRAPKERVAVMHFFAVTEGNSVLEIASAVSAGFTFEAANAQFDAMICGMSKTIRHVRDHNETVYMSTEAHKRGSDSKADEAEVFKRVIEASLGVVW